MGFEWTSGRLISRPKSWHVAGFMEDNQQLQLHLTSMNSPRFKFSKTLSAVAVAMALTSGSFAATLTLSLNATSNGNGLGGGSYTASGSGLDTSAYAPQSVIGGAGTFETFCLEYTEYFNSGSTYNYTLANAATLGGGGGAVGGQDPISMATAWLYSQFAAGTLAGYDYTNTANRKAANNDLQLAIWFFEDETGSISGKSGYGTGSGNVFLNAAVAQFGGSVAAAKADANGAFGVQVLNLTDKNGTHKQSQLYVAPTRNVPDAASTLGLLVLGLGGLAAARRFGKRRV